MKSAARKNAYGELAAWLAGWETQYGRDPKAFDAAFAGISRLKERCAKPFSADEKYRRMTADEKLAFRVDVCRKYESEASKTGIRESASKFGVPAGTLLRWLTAWRAGGVPALRFDYSGVGRKKSVERRP